MAVYRYFGMKVPQADTIDDFLRLLPPRELEVLKAHLVRGLIEQKVLRKFRFLGKYYLVAIDATGVVSFEHQHCEHCLTKTSKNGIVTYHHYVLEAKLVTSSGLAISIASEFIMNPAGDDYQKQDCEQKAFVRLSEKIKDFFPRLPICILADGLYPNRTVFDICETNKWGFIITLKDGNLKNFQQEISLLSSLASKRQISRARNGSWISLHYAYLNEVEYGGKFYSWVRCEETITKIKGEGSTRQQFVYITNISQNQQIVVETADSGRLRWKIENEGFNTQKNQGYELQHKFSRVSFTAMQNYYQLLQIAAMINQFVAVSKECLGLLAEHSKQTLKNLWKNLIAYLLNFQTVEDVNVIIPYG